jgi:hypothetical protein
VLPFNLDLNIALNFSPTVGDTAQIDNAWLIFHILIADKQQ